MHPSSRSARVPACAPAAGGSGRAQGLSPLVRARPRARGSPGLRLLLAVARLHSLAPGLAPPRGACSSAPRRTACKAPTLADGEDEDGPGQARRARRDPADRAVARGETAPPARRTSQSLQNAVDAADLDGIAVYLSIYPVRQFADAAQRARARRLRLVRDRRWRPHCRPFSASSSATSRTSIASGSPSSLRRAATSPRPPTSRCSRGRTTRSRAPRRRRP